MVRATLHVHDAVTLELSLELGRPPPGGVLATLIGQDLARCAVVGDAARQCFEHQTASLVVGHRKTHQVAAVIIQKRRHVQPLVPAQQKREQVRLPQLVGLGALEAHLASLRLGLRHCAPLELPFLRQHPLHGRGRSANPQKALHHIADAPAPRLRLRRLRREDRGSACLASRAAHALADLHRQLRALRSTAPIPVHPVQYRRVRHPKAQCRFARRDLLFHHHPCRLQAHIQWPASPSDTCHLAGLQGGVRRVARSHLSTPLSPRRQAKTADKC